jgi:hypothetical protein
MIVSKRSHDRGVYASLAVGAALAALILLGLAGCAVNPVILMKNPQTNQVARCEGGSSMDYLTPQREAEACAKAYEAAGFQRVQQF